LQTSPVLQVFPQAPQCAGSICVFRQPSAPQLVNPWSQLAPHWPALQVRAPLSTAGHALAQPPQLSGSPVVFVQVTSQSVAPPEHSNLHAPAWQAACPPTGALHSALQAPQFLGSAAASTSQPFTTFPSQSRWPSRQVPVQVPPAQVVPGQPLPQPPQWSGLVLVFTQAPSQQVSSEAQLAQGSASPPSLPVPPVPALHFFAHMPLGQHW
jgi:hypothetical protein